MSSVYKPLWYSYAMKIRKTSKTTIIFSHLFDILSKWARITRLVFICNEIKEDIQNNLMPLSIFIISFFSVVVPDYLSIREVVIDLVEKAISQAFKSIAISPEVSIGKLLWCCSNLHNYMIILLFFRKPCALYAAHTSALNTREPWLAI